MEEIAKGIATNYYLQATSILIAVVTGVYAVWSVRKPVFCFLNYLGGLILPRVWQPTSELWRFAELGAKNPSYLIAVFVKQFVYLFGFGLLWLLADITYNALTSLPTDEQPDEWFLTVFGTFRSTMSFVIRNSVRRTSCNSSECHSHYRGESGTMIQSLLIANWGEIACRVIRTQILPGTGRATARSVVEGHESSRVTLRDGPFQRVPLHHLRWFPSPVGGGIR